MRHKLPKLLVTGGAGFIGSEFVRQAVGRGFPVTVIDNLSYAGDLARLKAIRKQVSFYKTDITHPQKIKDILKKERPDIIAHFAAETHVDRSLLDIGPFIKTNIHGTAVLIDTARKTHIKKFVHISTDEVYGEIIKGSFSESSPLSPSNPYAATKAAADFLVQSAIKAYAFPAVIVRSSNNYGPWQYPEKFIPVILLKALQNQKVPIYGEGTQVRRWLHVSDCVNAIFLVMAKGRPGEIYNVASPVSQKNIEIAKTILRLLNKPETLIQFVKDRPGHDRRYSLNCRKIRGLGWRPQKNFNKGMEETVRWATRHFDWLEQKLKFLQPYWKTVYNTGR